MENTNNQSENSMDSMMPETAEQPPKKTAKKALGWIIAVIVIVLVLGALYLFTDYFKSSSSNPQQTDPTKIEVNSFMEWKVVDQELTEDQIDRFHQKFLAARTALEENPDNFSGWLNLGQAKHSVGDFEGARDAWEQLSAIRPDNSLSFGNLAALYTYDLYDADKAAYNFEKAIENSAGEPFNPNYYRNYFEFQLYFNKDLGKAEQILLDGIEHNPESPDLPSALASFYADQGRYDDAIEYYEKSLEINPTNTAINQEIRRLQELNK